jgi:predicted nucleic-acid-binding protein
MKGVDTNVLVRYLTQDDPAQSRRANAIIDEALTGGDRVHVDVVVFCELVWVLRAAYGFARAVVADTLTRLLGAAQLSLEDRDLLRQASQLYLDGSGDFADYVLALRNRAAGCDVTLTFDRGLGRSDLFQVL